MFNIVSLYVFSKISIFFLKPFFNWFSIFYWLDCDPSQKQPTSELESLVNRLERLVDRLERTVSARELEYTNNLLTATHQVAVEAVQHAIQQQQITRRPDAPPFQRGATIEEDTLKSLSYNNSLSEAPGDLPTVLPDPIASDSTSSSSTSLKQRIAKLEDCINRTDDDLLNNSSSGGASVGGVQIPTVVESMSVYAYQDIVSGPLAQWLALSTKIGGDVATQADFVRKAFE